MKKRIYALCFVAFFILFVVDLLSGLFTSAIGDIVVMYVFFLLLRLNQQKSVGNVLTPSK